MKTNIFLVIAIVTTLIGALCAGPVQAGPPLQKSGSFSELQGDVVTSTAPAPDGEYDALNNGSDSLEIEELTPNMGYFPHSGYRPMTMLPLYASNSVPIFGQRWSPWAGDVLGFNGQGYWSTIGQHGCAVTCIAMEHTFFRGYMDPRAMNSWMKQHNGFWYNLVNFGAAPGFAGSRDYSRSAADLGYINSLLDRGYLVIAMTYFPPSRTITHFVLITGHSGNTYAINDPWTGDRTTFNARFGDPSRWIYNINFYH